MRQPSRPQQDLGLQKASSRGYLRLFVQILEICKESGLVKLGYVALDGTKVKANASKHKAMSYGRMVKKEKELAREVEKLLKEAEALDEKEDKNAAKAREATNFPEELKFKEGSGLQKSENLSKRLKRRLMEEAASKGKGRKGGKPPEDGPSGTSHVKPETEETAQLH